jgi:hypothetical protein
MRVEAMAAKKSRATSRASKPRKSSVEIEIDSWLENAQVDKIADYAQRGRCHAGLSDERLTELWKAAMRTLAANPSRGKVRAEQDLSSEFRLRGTHPPFKEVKDELEILVHTISERVTRMKADDPGAWEAAGDSLARAIEEFVAKRDRPKT